MRMNSRYCAMDLTKGEFKLMEYSFDRQRAFDEAREHQDKFPDSKVIVRHKVEIIEDEEV